MARNEQSVADSLAAIAASSADGRFVAVDATDASSISKAFELVGRPVDVLVYNASAPPSSGSILDLKPEDVQRSFAINAVGMLLCSQAVLPSMIGVWS